MAEQEDLVSITGGPLKPHEYVLVKPYINAGDEAWIQNHSAKSRGQGKDVELVLTIGEVQLATAKRMVKGWNLTRTITSPIDGTKTEVAIPFSTHAIEELRRPLYRYILKKINELNEEDEDEEGDDDFLPAVVDSSEDSFQTERVLRLKH